MTSDETAVTVPVRTSTAVARHLSTRHARGTRPRPEECIIGAMPARSLYRRILGDKLDLLPEALRSFHASTVPRRAEGIFRIERGRGLLARLIARIGGLPPNAEQVAVSLEVRPDGDRERWIRTFGNRPLASLQWEKSGLLVERLSPLTLGIELVPDATGLRYQVRKCWLGPIPVPRALAPKVATTTVGREDGWRLFVRVDLPFTGMLIKYEGDIRCHS